MLLYVGVASALPYAHQALRFNWTAASGPVDHYEVAWGARVVLTPVNEIMLYPKHEDVVEVRVRGIGTDGQVGPWSIPSQTFRVERRPSDLTGDGVVATPDFIMLSQDYGTEGWELR
jgi:hypothetical protein